MLTRSKQLLIFGCIMLVLSASAAYSFVFFRNDESESTTQIELVETSDPPSFDLVAGEKETLDSESSQSLFEKFQSRFTANKTLSVLLLGYGGAGHSGGMLADAIQVVRLDFNTQTITFIAIPRDLWLTLPNDKQGKINQVFTLGTGKNRVLSGGAVAKEAISDIVGFPIDYFIATDFTGFKRIIGQELKGLTITAPEALSDRWYPILGEEQNTCGKSAEEVAQLTAQYSGFELEKQFECRYLDLHVPAGVSTLQGEDALAYVRSRHGSSSGDFSRGERQQVLLSAFKTHFLTVDGLKQASKLFTGLVRHTTTDVNLELVEYVIPAAANLGQMSIKNIGIHTGNVLEYQKSATGQSILVSKSGLDNWEAIQKFIQQ